MNPCLNFVQYADSKIYMVKPLNVTPHLAVYHEILLYTCHCHAFITIKWSQKNVLDEEGSYRLTWFILHHSTPLLTIDH